jgi:hypothetical protein
MQTLLLFMIRMYRAFLSPWFGNQCRFSPTCSAYAEQSIKIHGWIKGLWLSVRRLAKCHPWHHGGHDPVPGGQSFDKING